MAPGDEYRVVMFDGVAGLSDELAVALGQWYRQLTIWQSTPRTTADAMLFHWNPKTNQSCSEGETDCVSMTKDQWVMTSRDSLFALVERAQANFESDYAVISPPKPPRRFAVDSGPNQILISWEPTEVPDGGWEIYRAQNRHLGIPAPFPEERYQLIASLPANATSYADSEVERNVSYFYYMQAVGAANNVDPLAITGTPDGSPLKSSRYYAQSYDPARLSRPPGASLADARIVPNPYNLGSNAQLRWPDVQNQIAFLDIPGSCTIEIFTELGERVKTIVHRGGNGDENWNLTTESNQLIVSGIYIAVITDDETGDSVKRKFVVIR